jgi:hypothetical protein
MAAALKKQRPMVFYRSLVTLTERFLVAESSYLDAVLRAT